MSLQRRLLIFATEIYYHGGAKPRLADQHIFLSPHARIARDYANQTVFKSGKQTTDQPAYLHSFELKFGADKIFDPQRRAELDKLIALVKQHNKTVEPDWRIDPNNLVQRGQSRLGLSFAYMRDLRPMLIKLGFKAAIVNEGSQDYSLNVFNPMQDLQTVKTEQIK